MSVFIISLGICLMLLFQVVFVVSLASIFKPIRRLGFESRRTALKWTVLALIGSAAAPTLIDGLTGKDSETDIKTSLTVGQSDQIAASGTATPSAPLRSSLPATPVVEPVTDRTEQPEPADAVLCGARHVGKVLIASKATATCPWSFTVPEVTLACQPGTYSSVTMETYYLTVEAKGTTYALNGFAKKHFLPFDPIWSPDPQWPNMKINIGPWLRAAQALCHLPEASTANSAADGQRTVAVRLPACLSQKDDDIITELAAARDIPAFEKAVNNRIALRTCRMLRVGEAVYIQDRTWTGQVCLRSPGEERCWWTSSNAVSR
jgi:hypothetical protein